MSTHCPVIWNRSSLINSPGPIYGSLVYWCEALLGGPGAQWGTFRLIENRKGGKLEYCKVLQMYVYCSICCGYWFLGLFLYHASTFSGSNIIRPVQE